MRRILKKREEHAKKRSENQEKRQKIGSNAYGSAETSSVGTSKNCL